MGSFSFLFSFSQGSIIRISSKELSARLRTLCLEGFLLLTANMKEKVGQAVSVSRGISFNKHIKSPDLLSGNIPKEKEKLVRYRDCHSLGPRQPLLERKSYTAAVRLTVLR